MIVRRPLPGRAAARGEDPLKQDRRDHPCTSLQLCDRQQASSPRAW